jgi:hypothetical protein
LTVRSARAVPLPRDATPDQIVELCASTGDLVAFAAALKWIDAADWPDARARLEGGLIGPIAGGASPESLMGQRDARSRLAMRFHKLQLIRVEDSSRRSNEQAERRRATAVASADAAD